MTHRNPIPKLPRGAVATLANVSGVKRGVVRAALRGERVCGQITALILERASQHLGIPTLYAQWRSPPNWKRLREIISDYWEQAMARKPPLPVRVWLGNTYGEDEKVPERYQDCKRYEACLEHFSGMGGGPEGVFGCRACPEYEPTEHPVIDPHEEMLRSYALIACVFNGELSSSESRRWFIRPDFHLRDVNNRRLAQWNKSPYGRLCRRLYQMGTSITEICAERDINPETSRRWFTRYYKGQNISDAGKAFVRSVLSETGTGEDDERAAHQ